MLELQAKHNEGMLAMSKQNSEMQFNFLKKTHEMELQMERLKSGGEDGDNWFGIIEGILPLIKNSTGQTTDSEFSFAPFPVDNQPQKPIIPEKLEEVKPMDKVEETKDKIRKGLISEEEAYKLFCEEMPQHAKLLSRADFTKKFNEIKEGK
jgi:hypothetical protein